VAVIIKILNDLGREPIATDTLRSSLRGRFGRGNPVL
jgi:hypothetical protein